MKRSLAVTLPLALIVACGSTTNQQPHVTPDSTRGDAGAGDAASVDAEGEASAATNTKATSPPWRASVHSASGDKQVNLSCESRSTGKLTCRYGSLKIERGKQWSATELAEEEKAIREAFRKDPSLWTKDYCRGPTPALISEHDSYEGYPSGTSVPILEACRTKNADMLIAYTKQLHQIDARTCTLSGFSSVYEFEEINRDTYQARSQWDGGCRFTTLTTLFRDAKEPEFWNLKTSITAQPPDPRYPELSKNCSESSDETLNWGNAPVRVTPAAFGCDYLKREVTTY